MINSKSRMNMIIMILIMILSVIMVQPGTAEAAGYIDTDTPVSLTLSCQADMGPITGQSYDLYLVATTDKCGELTVTDEFKSFNIDIFGENDEAWRTLASTLEGYVLLETEKGNIKPAGSGSTDSSGRLTFPAAGQETLSQGLYLVVGHYHEQYGYYYDTTPFMVKLPTLDSEKNVWEYIVTSNTKQETGIAASPNYVSRKAIKVWNDKGYEKSRPKEVTVKLLCDGIVYDTVKLNAANNWSHTWEKLDGDCKWNVIEEFDGDYKVEITKEGISFVIKNTCGDNGNLPGGKGNSKLPQTGVLWWPVPVMSAAGLTLIGIGLLRRKSRP